MAILVLLAVSIWLIRYGIKRERKYKAASAPVAAPVYQQPVPIPKAKGLSTIELQAWRMYHLHLLNGFIEHARQTDWENKELLIRTFEELKTGDYYTEYAEIIHDIVLHPEKYEGDVKTSGHLIFTS